MHCCDATMYGRMEEEVISSSDNPVLTVQDLKVQGQDESDRPDRKISWILAEKDFDLSTSLLLRMAVCSEE